MISALAEAMMYYRFKRSHRIILDIGGFLGETALWFIGSRQAKKVVIVEPIPLFVKYIKTNLKNCLVDVVQAAVCHKPVARLKVNGIFSRITENSGQGEVPAVSLEELLSLYDATAIKMDCEGCEQVLIETPYEVLSRIDEMIIELHYGLVDVHNIRKKMKEYGFYEVVLYDDLANNKILHKFPVVLVHFFRESENL
jgi:FkbM family methyltransferase